MEDPKSKKKIAPVVNGPVRTKKKNEIVKIKDAFIAEDIRNVGSFIFIDVLVPAIKNAISDIITNGVDMILFGGNGRSKKRGISDKVSYTKYYDRNDRFSSSSKRSSTRYSYDDIILDSYVEARDVLDRMDELIDQYGIVSVADLYDLGGLIGEHTDNKYGWTNLRNAEPVRCREGGYALKLPRAMPID